MIDIQIFTQISTKISPLNQRFTISEGLHYLKKLGVLRYSLEILCSRVQLFYKFWRIFFHQLNKNLTCYSLWCDLYILNSKKIKYFSGDTSQIFRSSFFWSATKIFYSIFWCKFVYFSNNISISLLTSIR